MGKKTIVVIASIVLLFTVGNITKLYFQTEPPFIGFGKVEKNYVSIPSQKLQKDTILYKGEDGKDAQTILIEREKAWIEHDGSGLIISINDRKADAAKHEYWAFYVNGKLAQVGPAEYISKDGDVIEWKIEKY